MTVSVMRGTRDWSRFESDIFERLKSFGELGQPQLQLIDDFPLGGKLRG
ncbi:MAG: hypothetical protein RLZZ444_1572 [Pseudomonadota bacterium]